MLKGLHSQRALRTRAKCFTMVHIHHTYTDGIGAAMQG